MATNNKVLSNNNQPNKVLFKTRKYNAEVILPQFQLHIGEQEQIGFCISTSF